MMDRPHAIREALPAIARPAAGRPTTATLGTLHSSAAIREVVWQEIAAAALWRLSIAVLAFLEDKEVGRAERDEGIVICHVSSLSVYRSGAAVCAMIS